jgi:hypothetical protein
MEAIESPSGKSETSSDWGPEADALLENWRKRVYAAQSAYYIEAERFMRWHYILGIAVVVMSTIVGSSTFSAKEGGPGLPSIVIGILGSLAAILAGLQTLLKPAETAARHGVAADWYSAIRRDIEELQALPRHLRGDVRLRLDAVRSSMNKVGQNAPVLSERLWARAAQRFGVDEPPLAKP